jgi:hypothetical protein
VPKDRYLILSVRGDAQAYVQCLFLPDKPKVLCEASSGIHRVKAGDPPVWQLAPERVSQLNRLGFATDDRIGNYQQELDLGILVDLSRIADIMLTALHHGYGADRDTRILWEAPLVPGKTDIAPHCGAPR